MRPAGRNADELTQARALRGLTKGAKALTMRFSTGEPLFQVDLAVLRRGSLKVDRRVSADELSITARDAELQGDLRVCLEITLRGSRVLVRGNALGLVSGPCRRCLEAVELEAEAPVDLTYGVESGLPGRPEPDEDFGEDVGEEGGGDLDGSFQVLEAQDLGPGLRDCFLIACPTSFLCREDCKGLCPRCGTNLNLESCECGERT